MIIAIGNSRKTKILTNSEISWNEFLDLAKNTRRTTETLEEYNTFNKNKQDEIKDGEGLLEGS